MKNKTLIGLAAVLSLCSCGKAQNTTSSQTAPVTTTAQLTPVQADLSGLSTEKIGYGQGVQVDSENRTTGALDFNVQYKKYSARAIDEKNDKITLTFDQGYENGYTSKILDTLKEKKVKAVFFLLQDYAQKNPELVQRMIDEGHIIGNHSVHHYSMPTLDEQACKKEIMDFHKYMQDNFNYTMNLFRPPMGEFSEKSLAVTKECGYKTLLWSFAYCDWDTQNQPDKAQSLKKIIDGAHRGEIMLLHSVSETNAEILGEVIDKMREKGYEFN